jgi:hypothetical protein
MFSTSLDISTAADAMVVQQDCQSSLNDSLNANDDDGEESYWSLSQLLSAAKCSILNLMMINLFPMMSQRVSPILFHRPVMMKEMNKLVKK